MDLDTLYEVLDGSVQIQVYSHDLDEEYMDGIVFEGTMWDSYKAVEPYMYWYVIIIEVDEHGKVYVGLESR